MNYWNGFKHSYQLRFWFLPDHEELVHFDLWISILTNFDKITFMWKFLNINLKHVKIIDGAAENTIISWQFSK